MSGLPMPAFEERKVGAMWVITSPAIVGLYVAHSDLEVARADLWPTIKAMDMVRERVAVRTTVMHKAAFAI